MSNYKQTSVDIIYQGMSDKIVMQDLNKALICIHISHDDFLKLHKQAKAMQKQQAEHYATFITNCVNNNLPTITFNDWINLENNEQQ